MPDYYFPAALVPEITSGRKNRIIAALPASGLLPPVGSRVQLYCGSGKKDRALIAQGRICAVQPVLLWGDLMAVDGQRAVGRNGAGFRAGRRLCVICTTPGLVPAAACAPFLRLCRAVGSAPDPDPDPSVLITVQAKTDADQAYPPRQLLAEGVYASIKSLICCKFASLISRVAQNGNAIVRRRLVEPKVQIDGE